ncbi:MAG: flagellar assembly peptidoglycan hydrolase FlgJ [Acidiferrobacterales bacterium]
MVDSIPNAGVYTDFQGLDQLSAAVKQDGNSKQNLREVATQFEALFTQMMLKSMRKANFSDPLFGGQQVNFYQDLYDNQLALALSQGHGLGLASMLVKQLGGSTQGADKTAVAEKSKVSSAVSPSPADPQKFVHMLWPQAVKAARAVGVSPAVLLAQAAHETGWGQSIAQMPDGTSSYNLFGIKAGGGWNGPSATVPTLEYADGVAKRGTAAFRAYDSYAQSFSDYVQFLKDNPRYTQALKSANDPAAFIDALQKAGYATDPHYAREVQSVLSGEALRHAIASLKSNEKVPLKA